MDWMMVISRLGVHARSRGLRVLRVGGLSHLSTSIMRGWMEEFRSLIWVREGGLQISGYDLYERDYLFED